LAAAIAVAGGERVGPVFAIGASCTPTALDHAGRSYALNAGQLSVLGL